jgi:tetratricopeptide (TPR) repeat protein
MAPRAARRGAQVLVVLLLVAVLFVGLLVVSGVSLPELRATACARLAGVVPVDRIIPACAAPAKAGVALRAGRAAVHRHAFREALGHYRAAAAAAPDVLAAHVGHGEVAEILGEYDEALVAFQRAAALAPSPDTTRRVAGVAERLGRVDVALQSVGSAHGPWRQHASVGVRSAAAHVATCLPLHWPNPVRIWQACVAGAREAYGFSYDASHGSVARWVFRVLVEDGRRDRALDFARERGWRA